MPQVFISYRHDDTIQIARRLKLALQTCFDVFLDESEDGREIELGHNIGEVTRSHAHNCDILFALIGPQWLKLLQQREHQHTDYMREEIEVALFARTRVVAVLVDGAEMPPCS